MPKKFTTENTKAVAARARKTAVKEEEQSKKQKQVEDAMWQEDDKHIQKKQQRKEDQERKKQEIAGRKAENKALLEQEMLAEKKIRSAPLPPPPKVTRAHISETLDKMVKKEKPKEESTHLETPLEENLNRVVIEGEHAHSVTEAISLLSTKEDEIDKHPEKRMKAAYTEFEDRRLKELKEEKPTLRLSQLKQLIFKEWQKSPDNPLNK